MAENLVGFSPAQSPRRNGDSMSVSTTTHVNFRGETREARVFYQSVLGGEVAVVCADIHAAEEPAQSDQVALGHLDAPTGSRS